MTQKTVGYVELEWTCPNCGSRNKGSVKICAGCGAAQPADVQFQQAAEENLLEKKGDAVSPGPDLHCPFCGVRNPGSAETCSNCGGDLTGAQKRASGQVLGAHRSQAAPPVACPACGENNPAANQRCSRCGAPLPGAPAAASPVVAPKKPLPLALIIGLVVGCVLIGVLFSLLFSSKDVTAQVVDRSWERSIVIEQFGPLPKEGWEEDLPSEAKNISCADKYRDTSNEPAPKSTEVCGTPYTVDQGDGTGKVVQDCEYKVYDAYCEYTLDGWAPVREDALGGDDEPPTWPDPQLGTNQRAGESSERYTIVFEIDSAEKRYNTSDPELFFTAEPGSRWTVKVNGLGEIVEIVPAN